MKLKVYRETFSPKAFKNQIYVCAAPSKHVTLKTKCPSERSSLYTLKKGSLTVEAALVLPFFLCILLGFFSFFGQYAAAAELSLQAGAEAKKLGIVLSGTDLPDKGEITISKTYKPDWSVGLPFFAKSQVTQTAVCRAWIGFEKLQMEETFVYITPGGRVYHLFSDCTHLKLSISTTTRAEAASSKNQNGKKYRPCSLCKKSDGFFVFITREGDCYHFERSCSGLKRTIRYVPLSEAIGRACCLRCCERGE